MTKNLLLPLLLLLPAFTAAHESETHYDHIQLSASAQTRLANDIILATLYAEEEGSQPTQLADIVNRKVQWAVALVKQHPQIRLQTSAYTTSPVYRSNKITAWRVRQTISLESQDMTAVSELLGELQQQLALQGMNFAVSPELRNQTDDALISDALAAFERRAKRVSDQLGRKGYRIVDLNISTSGNAGMYQRFEVRAMAMDTIAAPTVEAGEQDVQVTVSGSIELE